MPVRSGWAVDPNATIEVLERDARAVVDGDTTEIERTLYAQGKTLDGLFHHMLHG